MKIKQPFETVTLALPFPAAPVVIVSVTPIARELVPGGAALTVAGSAIVGSAVEVTLGAGADGERYLITVRATDAGGIAMEREAEIGVVDLSWAVPTLSNPYLSATAFVERLGLDDAALITATSDGSRIDAARLQRAIDDAQGEADGYLAARYLTPLSSFSAVISTIVFDLALARLYTSELPKAVAERRDRAQALLRDIASGKATLPGAAGLAPAPTSPEPVLFQVNERILSRDKLRAF